MAENGGDSVESSHTKIIERIKTRLEPCRKHHDDSERKYTVADSSREEQSKTEKQTYQSRIHRQFTNASGRARSRADRSIPQPPDSTPPTDKLNQWGSFSRSPDSVQSQDKEMMNGKRKAETVPEIPLLDFVGQDFSPMPNKLRRVAPVHLAENNMYEPVPCMLPNSPMFLDPMACPPDRMGGLGYPDPMMLNSHQGFDSMARPMMGVGNHGNNWPMGGGMMGARTNAPPLSHPSMTHNAGHVRMPQSLCIPQSPVLRDASGNTTPAAGFDLSPSPVGPLNTMPIRPGSGKHNLRQHLAEQAHLRQMSPGMAPNSAAARRPTAAPVSAPSAVAGHAQNIPSAVTKNPEVNEKLHQLLLNKRKQQQQQQQQLQKPTQVSDGSVCIGVGGGAGTGSPRSSLPLQHPPVHSRCSNPSMSPNVTAPPISISQGGHGLEPHTDTSLGMRGGGASANCSDVPLFPPISPQQQQAMLASMNSMNKTASNGDRVQMDMMSRDLNIGQDQMSFNGFLDHMNLANGPPPPPVGYGAIAQSPTMGSLGDLGSGDYGRIPPPRAFIPSAQGGRMSSASTNRLTHLDNTSTMDLMPRMAGVSKPSPTAAMPPLHPTPTQTFRRTNACFPMGAGVCGNNGFSFGGLEPSPTYRGMDPLFMNDNSVFGPTSGSPLGPVPQPQFDFGMGFGLEPSMDHMGGGLGVSPSTDGFISGQYSMRQGSGSLSMMSPRHVHGPGGHPGMAVSAAALGAHDQDIDNIDLLYSFPSIFGS